MSYPVIRANAPLLLLLLPTDKASMQELILQEHKQIFCKTCSCCKKNAWYVESKHILQPPKYLSIIVNRFSYINNKIIKNRSFIPLYKNIMPGPYKFNLWATVDHHGYSMNRGYYTASINCYGKTFHRNDTKITAWRRHQMETFPRCWSFVGGNHRSAVNSPHKGQWRGALMLTLICVWINMQTVE